MPDFGEWLWMVDHGGGCLVPWLPLSLSWLYRCRCLKSGALFFFSVIFSDWGLSSVTTFYQLFYYKTTVWVNAIFQERQREYVLAVLNFKSFLNQWLHHQQQAVASSPELAWLQHLHSVREYCILWQKTTKYLGNCPATHTCCISAMVGLILASVLLAKIIKFRKRPTPGTVFGFSGIQQHCRDFGWGDFLYLFPTMPTLKQELRQFFLLSGCHVNFACKNWNSCFTLILESVSTESEVNVAALRWSCHIRLWI